MKKKFCDEMWADNRDTVLFVGRIPPSASGSGRTTLGSGDTVLFIGRIPPWQSAVGYWNIKPSEFTSFCWSPLWEIIVRKVSQTAMRLLESNASSAHFLSLAILWKR